MEVSEETNDLTYMEERLSNTGSSNDQDLRVVNATWDGSVMECVLPQPDFAMANGGRDDPVAKGDQRGGCVLSRWLKCMIEPNRLTPL